MGKYETRKDPVTGCEVLTMKGFFDAEADTEGKGRSGCDLMNDFFSEMSKEEDELKRRYAAPTFLKSEVDRFFKECEDEGCGYDFNVTEILVVKDSQYHLGCREQSFAVVFKAKCSDGKERLLRYRGFHFSGSMTDPPDSEEEVEEVEEIEKSEAKNGKDKYRVMRS